MLVPATMRLCNNASFFLLLFVSALTLGAQQSPRQPAPAQAPPLTVDRDPVRSPDSDQPPSANGQPIHKEGEGYVLHTDVEEVILNATVLEGNRLVQDLKRDDF